MSRTTSTTRRVVIWSVAAAALAVLLTLAFYPKPVPVDLETVNERPLQVTLSHEGKTRVHDRYLVSAPVAGRVQRIELRPGDAVVGGQTVVATFVPAAPALLDVRTRAEATARVKAAEAGVSQARAALAEAEGQQTLAVTNRARMAQLFESALVSQQDRDQAETTARTTTDAARAARAAVAAAEHQLDAARAALVQATSGPDGDRGSLVLHAPITGVVLQRLHESAAVVPAGEPLVEVGNPADLEVVADYLSADAVKIRPGMVALIDRWGGGDPLRARVTTVEPYGFLKISALGVEEQRVNVIASFDDPRADWQTLGDGYRIEMRVVLWASAGVLTVPTSALFRNGDAWAVFVVADGRASERAVRIGHRSDTEAEVVGGLQAGDRVIVHPADTVVTGTRVTPRGDGGA
jgi:HlyD family secretion protein